MIWHHYCTNSNYSTLKNRIKANIFLTEYYLSSNGLRMSQPLFPDVIQGINP